MRRAPLTQRGSTWQTHAWPGGCAFDVGREVNPRVSVRVSRDQSSGPAGAVLRPVGGPQRA